MEISGYIKKYRKDNNLTQTDLARKLYVTKQTISKWERGESLPDISLYPVLADMFEVSIDELMGRKSTQEIKFKKKKYLIISMAVFLIVIISIFLVLCIPKVYTKTTAIKEFENELNVDVPAVSKFDIINYDNLSHYSNSYMFPQTLYSVIFKDELNLKSDKWLVNIDNSIMKIVPSSVYGFFSSSDYYLLYNVETKEINKVDDDYTKKTRYKLYFVQEEKKRLIIINFEVGG